MFVIIWPVVLADWLKGQLKDPKTKKNDLIRKTMALLQKIVATGNGQPPESPFCYPDKIKVS